MIDASILSAHQYIYSGFPKMKLSAKKEYLNYKMKQIKDSINNNGEFLCNKFETITKNIINVAKKILDYCVETGLIKYVSKPFISVDNCLAISIIYDNIKAILYTEDEIQSMIVQNIIVVNGSDNNFDNIEQNVNSKNNDDELFNLVLTKLDLLRD